MKLSQPSQSLIEQTIRKAIGKYPCDCEQTIITDIHLQPINGSGELYIFDDNDEELACATIEEWMTYNDENADFHHHAERVLHNALNKLKEGGSFDNLSIMQPYSFVLVDEEKETITDLLLMDNDTLLVSDELLKGLDEELDNFLKELLK